ncbi:MAG: LysM peptidoglycan-binding domain-containing protein [Myxococcota bacterium]
MRRTEILLVSLVAIGLSAAPAAAEDKANPPAAQTEAAPTAPASEPAAEPAATAAMPVEGDAPAATAGTTDASVAAARETAPSIAAETGEAVRVVRGGKTIVLGPQGVDDQGRIGRLHTVSRGDTLWDLSAAYLGTPWVWPSVWTDNHDIANPHRIRPGDRIWITANEMRVVSDDEADAFLERLVEESAAAEDAVATATPPVEPAAPAMDEEPLEEEMTEAPEEPVLAAVPDPTPTGRKITVSTRAAMGFLTEEQLAGASSIVDSPSERTNIAEGDVVYLGLGEGDTQVGDRFTIFEAVEIVREVGSNRILGHHVDVLGWVEVRQLTGDTSVGVIRMSYAEIRRGARILARPTAPRQVTVVRTPDAREGNIVFLPGSRTVMADGGYVYLNRGELDGLEVGSELEVVGRGGIRHDVSRAIDVQTPDTKVGTLVVVSVEPSTAVAFVLNAARELEVGDTVRPMAARLASR